MTLPENPLSPLTLDVRPILQAGQDPFRDIMQAVSRLAPGQAFRLLVPFEPVPLYNVLGRKGFTPRATRHAAGEWEILFLPPGAGVEGAGNDGGGDETAAATETRPVDAKAEETKAGEAGAAETAWPAPSLSLDNRGLAPPEPMIRILSALDRLTPGAVLEAWNDREPLFLYPELEKRGARIAVRHEAGGVHLLIRKGGVA